jgi:hypothetical protein
MIRGSHRQPRPLSAGQTGKCGLAEGFDDKGGLTGHPGSSQEPKQEWVGLPEEVRGVSQGQVSDPVKAQTGVL